MARDSRIVDSGSINGLSDMTIYKTLSCMIKKKPSILQKQEKTNGLTPLHEALKAGNIELALWMIKLDNT